ncbi:class F sortase [Luteipulveratus halotolerans]|uniref:class F sortase n=1 Tax=Luteipulveratus halotolerans TaxID=1631356 RepID=UPI0006815EA5|nr:class F sortase [Luteipulveratus halotolerans]
MTRKTSLASAALTVGLAVGLAACGTADQRADLPTQSPTSIDPGPARTSSAPGTPTGPAPTTADTPSAAASSASATSAGTKAQTGDPTQAGTGVRAYASSDGKVTSGPSATGDATTDGDSSTPSTRPSATKTPGTSTGSGTENAGTLRSSTTKRPTSRPVSVSVVSSSGRTLLTQSIGPVGLTNGELNPPGGVAGWYSGGGYVRPGYAGTSVLVGHITHAGAPDTFYNLPKAQPGDRVLIRYRDGSQMAFRVTQSAGRDKKAAQYDGSIWGKTSGPSLRLITCDLNTRIRAGHRTGNWVVWATPA